MGRNAGHPGLGGAGHPSGSWTQTSKCRRGLRTGAAHQEDVPAGFAVSRHRCPGWTSRSDDLRPSGPARHPCMAGADRRAEEVDDLSTRSIVAPAEAQRRIGRAGVREHLDPDPDRFPRSGSIPIEFVLQPGELLFVPSGWLHQVTSLDPRFPSAATTSMARTSVSSSEIRAVICGRTSGCGAGNCRRRWHRAWLQSRRPSSAARLRRLRRGHDRRLVARLRIAADGPPRWHVLDVEQL